MRKQLLCSLLAALLLCGCIGNACAAVWFAEPDTNRLHRDPFCADTRLSTALHAQAFWFDSVADINRQAEHALCHTCADAFPESAAPAPAQTLYYNPDGGEMLHANRDCPAVSETFLPLGGEMPASQMESSGMIPCPICTPVLPQDLQNIAQVWNATLEEKAALLPGVWTLPSADALSPDAIWDAATAFIESSPALMAHFPSGLYTACLCHYHTASDPSLAREHYRVLVTTVLQEPVGLVYVDALTGEVFGQKIVEAQPQ